LLSALVNFEFPESAATETDAGVSGSQGNGYSNGHGAGLAAAGC